MSIHPARVLASVLLIAGSAFVSVMALAIVIAKLLVVAGIAISPSNALLLADLITVLPFVALFAAAGLVGGCRSRSVASAGRTTWLSGRRSPPSPSAPSS